MEAVGVVATAASVVGISGVTAAFRFSRAWGRQYRFLRLHRSEPLDIILPTSERTEGGLGIRYLRTVTAMGNLRGATQVAQTVGRVSRSRPIRVTVSEELESPLSGDLVILGLPGKNAASRLTLAHLQERYPEINLRISESDQSGCTIGLGGYEEKFELRMQDDSSTIPSRDVALIVIWINPLAPHKRRLLLCAGFTAYGTAAAAGYLVRDMPSYRYAALRTKAPGFPSLLRRRWPCFALLIEVRIISDQVVEIAELALASLGDSIH